MSISPPSYRLLEARLIETDAPFADDLVFLVQPDRAPAGGSSLPDLLELASGAINLVSRDHAAMPAHQLSSVLAGALSCIERATMLAGSIAPVDAGHRPKAFDLADLLRSMQPLLQMICRPGRQLILTASSCLPVISGDGVALEAVLQTLVTHACREAPSGGDIVLNAAGATGFDGRPTLIVTVCARPSAEACAAVPDRGHGRCRDSLGLSMAMHFVRAKGGELHIDRPARGELAIMMQLPALRTRKNPMT